MTKEEKIQQIADLLAISGNTTKLVRFFVMQALPSIDESKLDQILAILTE